MEIRDALPEDAPAACEVIRRSISELCGADHLNDALILGRWLANKTPEIVTSLDFQARQLRPGRSRERHHPGGGLRDRRGADQLELCLTGREIPWGESRPVGCARN